MKDDTLERYLEGRLRKAVHEFGGMCIKFEAEKGLPDRIITLPGGATLFVELKQDRGRLSKLQKARIPQMRASGAIVAVMYGGSGLVELIDELTRWTQHDPLIRVCGLFNAKHVYCRLDHPRRSNQRHWAGGVS